MFYSKPSNDEDTTTYVEENIFSKHDDLRNRCKKLDSAVKLINDLNNFVWALSESYYQICKSIEMKDYAFSEKMINEVAWATTLTFPNFYENDRDFNSPKDILNMIYSEFYEDPQVVDILRKACDVNKVDMSKYTYFMK